MWSIWNIATCRHYASFTMFLTFSCFELWECNRYLVPNVYLVSTAGLQYIFLVISTFQLLIGGTGLSVDYYFILLNSFQLHSFVLTCAYNELSSYTILGCVNLEVHHLVDCNCAWRWHWGLLMRTELDFGHWLFPYLKTSRVQCALTVAVVQDLKWCITGRTNLWGWLFLQ